MSEALVPAVARPPAAHTGPAAMALPEVIVDAGPGGRRAVPGVLRGLDRQRADAGGVRRGGGAVPVVVCGSGAGPARDRAAARGGLHPRASGVGADGEAAPGRHPGAVRLASSSHQVLPANPAAAVRGPKHVVTKGATPVLTSAETRSLLDGIDAGSLVGLRDRALLSVMVYSFARVSAVVGMRRQDYFLQGTRGWLRLHEKGGKRHDVPAHHRAEAAVEAYLVAGGIEDAKAPLFQSTDRSGRLSGRSLTRRVVLSMIKRRASAAGLPASTCCHTFRATGITAYLSNGGTLEHAQQIAGHASPRTTKLYDRTSDTVTLDEIERIVI